MQTAIAERIEGGTAPENRVTAPLTLGTKIAFGAPTFAGAAMAIPLDNVAPSANAHTMSRFMTVSSTRRLDAASASPAL